MRTGRRRLAGALLLWLAAAPVIASTHLTTENYEARLERLRLLARANLLELVERRLLTKPPPSWHHAYGVWQLQLAELYRSRGAWQKLLDQLQPVIENAVRLERPPEPWLEQAELYIAEAHRELGDPAAARAALRRALLTVGHSDAHRRRLRRQIITDYLAEDALPALELAMQQFQNDYRPQDAEWRLLQARIQLRLGRPAQAIDLLAPLTTAHARLLGLYARLQVGELPAEALQASLAELAERAPAEFVRPIMAVRIAALRRGGVTTELIEALETYLGSPVPPDEPAGLPIYGREDLRRLYADFVADAANRAGLLVGDDQAWLEHAMSLPAAALERRAWFAHLWLEAEPEPIRRMAYDAFVVAQLAADHSALIDRLLDGGSGWAHLPLSPTTGLSLSNAALAAGHYALAATALTGLSSPPGLSVTDWTLHAARIELLDGRSDAGSARLHAWLDGVKALDPEVFDRALQPVFDLQRLEEHDTALVLLARLARFAGTPEQRRQMPYWMAESHAARGEHLIAAEQFLISALAGQGGSDLWGQAARHQAAESLIRAGLYADAGRLLQDLLDISDEPQRRERLQQRLQSLRALEAASDL